MVNMIEKKYTNEEMNIELTLFLDAKQNIWFLGKEIATILGYCNISKCIWDHLPCEDKRIISWSSKTEPKGSSQKLHHNKRIWTIFS